MAEQQSPTPNFYPISALPMIGSLIDGQVGDNAAQYKNLKQARGKPHVLDDELLERTEASYREQLGFHWVFEEQLSRWTRERLTASQQREVTRLVGQNEKNKVICEAILTLVEELKTGTIDRILEQDDLELGLDVLVGRIRPPGK